MASPRTTTGKTAAAAKKAGAATPTDRPKAVDQLRAEALEERPEGWELLLPVEQLRSAQMAELNAQLVDLFEGMGVDLAPVDDDATEEEKAAAAEAATASIEMNGDTIRAIGKMGALLESEGVVVDEAAFVAFDTGKGALTRVMNLAMWYLGELGE